jgi:hypothetical protein
MKNIFLILLFNFFLNFNSFAQTQKVNDEDLSPAQKRFKFIETTIIQPDSVKVYDTQTTTPKIRVFREFRKNLVELKNLHFKALNPTIRLQDECLIEAAFESKHFAIKSNGNIYKIQFKIPCLKSADIFFNEKSFGGEVAGVWQIIDLGLEKLEKTVGINFWKDKLTVKFPADGDYYAWGTLNITKGYQWDVIGHEFGHAVYDKANLGGMAGGSHKIDECYNPTLALSEGWATFFSAWLNLDLNDSDAKFEYLVPRRAPIQIENIPSDVCRGISNEWRVAGFFWDLIDFHQDNETSEISFKLHWDALFNSNSKNMNDVIKNLSHKIDPNLLDMLYKLNF